MLTRTPATLRKSNLIHSLPSNVALAVAIFTVAHRVMPCPYPSALHTYLSVFARACLGVMVQGSEHALAPSQRRRRWRSTPCHVVSVLFPLDLSSCLSYLATSCKSPNQWRPSQTSQRTTGGPDPTTPAFSAPRLKVLQVLTDADSPLGREDEVSRTELQASCASTFASSETICSPGW